MTALLSMINKKNTGKAYERLVHEIFTQLSPQATVTFDDRIKGKSGVVRKIDISIKQEAPPLGQLLTIIDAKDYKKPAGIKELAKLVDDVEDVGANRGVLISPKGFTNLAIRRAKEKGIQLYTAYDATNENWKGDIKVPVIYDSYDFHEYNLTWQFKGTKHAVTKTAFNYDFLTDEFFIKNIFVLPLLNMAGLGSRVYIEFLRIFDSNKSYKDLEKKHRADLRDVIVLYRNLEISFANLVFEYEIKRTTYIKYVVPDEYKGIMEYGSNVFKPSQLHLKERAPFINSEGWEIINAADMSIKTFRLNVQELDFVLMKFIRLTSGI